MSLSRLQNIPGIMRAHGWLKGARLMEIWFSLPATYVKPNYGPPDLSTIEMDRWLLTFPRAQKVYQEIRTRKIWTSDAAKRVLARQVRRSGGASSTPRPFGNLNLRLPRLHDDQVTYASVSELRTSLDDLTAALANFSLYVAVAGSVRNARRDGWQPGYEMTVTDIAIYAKDSYDFEGDQPLGFWDDEGNRVARGALDDRLQEVTNKSFRDWRSRNNKGGDFLVFSDVKRERLLKPDELWLVWG